MAVNLAGPGGVLSDLRVLNDPHVPGGPDGDCAVLHIRGCGLCSSHGREGQNGKQRTELQYPHCRCDLIQDIEQWTELQ